MPVAKIAFSSENLHTVEAQLGADLPEPPPGIMLCRAAGITEPDDPLS